MTRRAQREGWRRRGSVLATVTALAIVVVVTSIGVGGVARAAVPEAAARDGMPTQANTGPTTPPEETMTAARFLRTGRCEDRRIIGDVHVEDNTAASRYLGRTFTISGCTLGELFWSIDGTYGRSRYPTLTITDSSIADGFIMVSPMKLTIERSFVGGAFWAPCPNCTSQPKWSSVVRPMPVVVRDSLFVSAPGDPSSGLHVEALHVMGSGVGYRFEHTRFVQQGPYNGTQTAAINFSGRRSVWDDTWFDFGGTPAAAYFTVYIGGTDNQVVDCRVERGLASYVYPDEEQQADYRGCTDFMSDKPLRLP
jgi:hypothetical protein